MKLGERLQQERNKLKITQSEVAEKLKVSRQTISNWETEKSYPDLESLITLSDYYSISLDVLLKEDSGMVENINKKLKFVGLLKPILYVLCGLLGLTILMLPLTLFNISNMKGIEITDYFVWGLMGIKIILWFLFIFYGIKSFKKNEARYYKIETIVCILLMLFEILKIFVPIMQTINVLVIGNRSMDHLIVYGVTVLAFAQLYSMSSDEKNVENSSKESAEIKK